MNDKSLNDCVQMAELTDAELAQVNGGVGIWDLVILAVQVIIGDMDRNPQDYTGMYYYGSQPDTMETLASYGP